MAETGIGGSGNRTVVPTQADRARRPAGPLPPTFTVACCGRTWLIRPDVHTLNRVEEAAGEAVLPASVRLCLAALPMSQTAALLHALIADQPDAPTREAVDEWLFRRGLGAVAPDLAGNLLTLIAGSGE